VLLLDPGRLAEERAALAALCRVDADELPRLRERFVAAVALDDDDERAPRAARLAEMTRSLLDAAGLLKKQQLGLRRLISDAAGRAPVRPAPALDGALPTDRDQRGDHLVVDVEHPDVEALLRLAGRDSALAAFLLAKLLVPPPLPAAVDAALATAAWQLREAQA
jgi:hypothetical protein